MIKDKNTLVFNFIIVTFGMMYISAKFVKTADDFIFWLIVYGGMYVLFHKSIKYIKPDCIHLKLTRKKIPNCENGIYYKHICKECGKEWINKEKRYKPSSQ